MTARLDRFRNIMDAANTVLAEFMPVTDISDLGALREHLQSFITKENVSVIHLSTTRTWLILPLVVSRGDQASEQQASQCVTFLQ